MMRYPLSQKEESCFGVRPKGESGGGESADGAIFLTGDRPWLRAVWCELKAVKYCCVALPSRPDIHALFRICLVCCFEASYCLLVTHPWSL